MQGRQLVRGCLPSQLPVGDLRNPQRRRGGRGQEGGDALAVETFGATTGSQRKDIMGKEKCKLTAALVAEFGKEGDV